MTRRQRVLTISASAGGAALALAIGLIVALTGSSAPASPPGQAGPHNLHATPRTLLKEAPNASKAHDIGFRFGALPAGGKATASYSVKYHAATYAFRWSAAAKRWLVWMDGKPGMATEGGQL